MALEREEMLKAMLASDASYNGRFITGVLTTGIYCLPNCHARKPKPENVKFFPNGAEAAAYGLRPCKKCKPDEYERGEDRELDLLEALVAKLRQNPARYASVGDLGGALKIGPTKLSELFRCHYNTSPGEMLTSARIQTAKAKLVATDTGVAEIAFDVGFETLSAFNENFKRRAGVTPTEYRQLPNSGEATIQLPASYNVPTMLASLGRDPNSLCERVEGQTATLAFRTASGPACTRLTFDAKSVHVKILVGKPEEAFETASRMIGLDQDPRGFEQQAAEAGFGALVADRIGARIPQTPSLFDGLLWVIVGQQINLPFAFKLRQRLVAAYGEPVGDGLYATPTPERLAAVDPEELLPMQFSRGKAKYIVGIAKLGEAWLDELTHLSKTRIEQRLLKVNGLGPWSVNYLMMRALGYTDCVPYGDTGLQAGLRKLHTLEGKIDREQTDRLLAPFSPYRSLATYHLWQSLKESA